MCGANFGDEKMMQSKNTGVGGNDFGNKENKKPSNFISDYLSRDLTCSNCGTHRSVKYEINGKPFCNLCVLINT